jgi:hypothetical protein
VFAGGVVVVMNCCAKYGNCNQGRDCPVRVARTFPPSILKRLLGRFFYWLLTAMLGLLWLAFLLYCAYVYAN